jgi:hypothetical protein
VKSNDISFCLSVIGKPWVSGACGPDAFDCWGLIKYIYLIQRGILLCPFAGVKESGLLGMMKTAQAEAMTHWRELAKPEHFACVGMGRGRRVEHVGLWLDEGNGGILHTQEGVGVTFQSMAAIRQSGMQHFTFYQLKK